MRRAALVAVLLLAARATADEPAARPPASLRLATERVVVFKDGHGLFVKRGEATADAQGRVWTEEVPDDAALGTFWASADGDRVLGMRAEWVVDRTSTASVATTPLDLLTANVGRKVTLDFAAPGRAVTGTILEVGTFALLQVDDDRVAVPVAEVRTVRGADLSTTRKASSWSRRKRLSFDVGAAGAGKPVALKLMYFRPGVRWIPTYRLSGRFEASGDLALQGELLNEAEEIVDAAVDLVVGVPNFRFGDEVSPLTLETAMRRVLPQLDASSNRMLMTQMANNEAGEGAEARAGSASLSMAPELAAAQGQDLFVYGVPRLSLAKGARATLPLWQASVPVRHLYTLDVEMRRDGAGESRRRDEDGPDRRSPLRLAHNDVWHRLELSNRTETPWTTGAVLLLQGALPLAQELLTYTSSGATALVPVTVATDVRGDYAEEEVERRQEPVSLAGHRWTLVRKRGTFTVVNRRADRIDLRVRLSTDGKAEETTDAGVIALDEGRPEDWSNTSYPPATVNSHSDVRWDLSLDPGQTRTVSVVYAYFAYVP